VGHEGSIGVLSFGVLGGRPVLLSAGSDDVVAVWDPAVANPIRVTVPLGSRISDVVTTSDGRLAIASGRGVVVLDVLA